MKTENLKTKSLIYLLFFSDKTDVGRGRKIPKCHVATNDITVGLFSLQSFYQLYLFSQRISMQVRLKGCTVGSTSVQLLRRH